MRGDRAAAEGKILQSAADEESRWGGVFLQCGKLSKVLDGK